MEVESFSLILSFRYSHNISTRGAASSASRTMIWDISWIDRSANERAEHLRCLFLGLPSCRIVWPGLSCMLFTSLPDSVKILKIVAILWKVDVTGTKYVFKFSNVPSAKLIKSLINFKISQISLKGQAKTSGEFLESHLCLPVDPASRGKN